MNWWILLTPIIGALAGYILVSVLIRRLFHPLASRKIAGITVQGIFPARQQEMAATLGRLSASMLSMQEIEQKITNPENVKKIMPQAEAQIDHFLRVKLVKSMPVVGMFVGDKTINNLKELFMTELEQLFPEIMKNYMDRLQEDFNIEAMVTAKLAAMDPASMEAAFHSMLKKELNMARWMGALLGLAIGALQLLVLWLATHSAIQP